MWEKLRNIIRKLILLVTGISMALQCFFPVRYYRDNAYKVDTTGTVLNLIGIAIIGGTLFYILGGKKRGKD